MSLPQLLLLAVGLSMDAFAVAVCKGLKMKKIDVAYSLLIAAFFGAFQALMPLLGWSLGRQFEQYIRSFDHWIAFILLCFIGVQMIGEAFHDEPEEDTRISYDWKELLVLSFATSIDALAIGITFAFLRTSILPAVTIIGTVTFCLSFLGVVVGNRFGLKYKEKAELLGGIILILIGIKILLEHLQIFPFNC